MQTNPLHQGWANYSLQAIGNVTSRKVVRPKVLSIKSRRAELQGSGVFGEGAASPSPYQLEGLGAGSRVEPQPPKGFPAC